MTTETDILAVELFASEPDVLYPVDVAAQLAGMPRHLVLVCCRRGLVAPRIDPNYGGFYFDETSIRTLQRIEYLRSACAINLAGIHIILQLMAEVEHLRARAL
jgi:DNA-binding transcriptional MerR regulator